jgi:formylglycine-generating enzyme required for sulfatase activity
VFISYSRANRAWVDRLRTTMAPLLRESGEELVLWEDSQIRPGERWQQTIETALARARVALLLVSAEFLASDFVMGREVPVLLEAAEREGVPILWVCLSPCWVSRTPIHAYQAVLPPETSLEEMTEPQQRRALVRIAEEVHQALEAATERERRRVEEETLARRLREEERQRVEREAREAERERERQRIQTERERREAERKQAEAESRARRRREEEETLARHQREARERQARAAAERQRIRQRQAEEMARARQQLRAGMERLLTRRKLLLAAAGLPLGAIGLARLASQPRGSGGPATASRAPTGQSSRAQPVAAGAPPVGQRPAQLQTMGATHGWLERQGQGWRIQTRPLQVRSRLEQLAPDVPLRLIQIPAGRFLMGSPPEELERSADEGPQHEVALPEFWLGQTPITQAQWRVVASWPKVERELAKDPSLFKGDGRPVERVSWHDAMEFSARLSRHTGRIYTLPSESQWEYACRAGTTTPFAFGETISPELANYDGTFAYANGPTGVNRGATTPAGNFPANAWGLQDMHGNVWEWCLDHWHESYSGAPSDGSAWLSSPGVDAERLLRGGSWFFGPWFCRSACRLRYLPGFRDFNVGFRVCCLPQDSASLHLSP